MRFYGEDGIDRGIDGTDRLEQSGVFPKLIKITTPQVRENNSLPLRPVGAPLEAGFLKILHDQTLMEFERRDGVAELRHTAIGFEKVQKCQADGETCWKTVTS